MALEDHFLAGMGANSLQDLRLNLGKSRGEFRFRGTHDEMVFKIIVLDRGPHELGGVVVDFRQVLIHLKGQRLKCRGLGHQLNRK